VHPECTRTFSWMYKNTTRYPLQQYLIFSNFQTSFSFRKIVTQPHKQTNKQKPTPTPTRTQTTFQREPSNSFSTWKAFILFFYSHCLIFSNATIFLHFKIFLFRFDM
jgi:hypothetical protein